jgi:hypothetical protein
MRPLLLQPRALASLAAAAVLSACAGHSGNALLPALPSAVAPSSFAPLASPPTCPKQKSSSKDATLTVTLSTSGGSFCVPAFGGIGGFIEYPTANPSVKLKLISSTSNYNHKLPSLSTGTAIFYLQLALTGPVSFGTHVPAGGGLAGKKFVPSQTYTAFGESTSPVVETFKPCYLVAKKNKYGGIISGVGTLLKGVSIPLPVAVKGVIEIYSGKHGSPCT